MSVCRLLAAGTVLGGLVGFAGLAAAQQVAPGFYGSLGAGLLMVQDVDYSVGFASGTMEFKTGYTLAGALGYRLGNGLRIEGEFGYGRSEIDKVKNKFGVSVNARDVDVKFYSFTANLFYDFNTGTQFTPYLGGGIGVVRVDQSSGTIFANGSVVGGGFGTQVKTGSDSETNLSLLGEVGVAIALTPQWSVVPAYRLQWVDNGGNGVDSTFAHNVRVAVRYNF